MPSFLNKLSRRTSKTSAVANDRQGELSPTKPGRRPSSSTMNSSPMVSATPSTTPATSTAPQPTEHSAALTDGVDVVLTDLDGVVYRGRNAIERMFRRLRNLRRIATRYDELATNIIAAICLASMVTC